MKALLDRAVAIGGLEQVLLSVTSAQAAALALYRSLGFETFGTEPRALNISGEFIDENYLVLRLKQVHHGRRLHSWRKSSRKGKSALTFSVQDASAALPQNCQTTNWIVEVPHFGVNVTLVMEIAQS